MQKADSPKLEIILWLEPQLEAAIQSSAQQFLLVEALEKAAGNQLQELGLPASAKVTIDAGIPGEHRAALLALQVNGQTLPSSPGLENRLLAVLHGRLLNPGESGPAIPGWLQGLFKDGDKEKRQAAIQYLASLNTAILGENPELLIDENQVSSLKADWSQEAAGISRLSTAWLHAVLREMLAAHLPVAGGNTFLNFLLDHRRASPLETAEAAIVSFLPKTLRLCLPRHLLRAYTLEDVRLPTSDLATLAPGTPTSLSSGAFFQMGQQLYADLGLNMPRLEFEIDDDTAQQFAFHFYGLQCPPYPALPPGKVLVDTAPQTLEMMNISAQAVLHPLDGRLCSLVSLGDETPPAERGYFTWNGIEYLALCLSDTLRAHPGCLVHSLSVNTWLEEMEKNAPDLVEAIRAAYPEGYAKTVLVRTLRSLVQQGISMAGLHPIFEALLHPAILGVPSAEWSVIGDAMPATMQLAQSDWRSDPEALAAFTRWYLSLPPISLSPATQPPAAGLGSFVSIEQYAEPLTQEQRMTELAKRYSNEEIQHYLSLIAVVLVIKQEPDLPDFVNEKLEELFAKLSINSGTPADAMLRAIVDYFTENPVNPQLVQDSTAAIRAEVPHNVDAFTTRWHSKYIS